MGANVRDAACYVCWAFARAYEAAVMEPHVRALAGGLVVMSVYDREVNCRRAASAAFQENVGRQGNYPNGIDIITTADYFTVSNVSRAYTEIAPTIFAFAEYQAPLLNHLLDDKVCARARVCSCVCTPQILFVILFVD